MTTEQTPKNELDRREFIRRASAAAVVGLGSPYVWGQRTDETLVVNSFGGEYQELFEKNIIEPFEKKFGVKVIHDATGTSSQDYAKIRASKGAPGFDVAAALSPPEVILGAKEGLLEKITDKEVPNLKYTWEKARQTLPPVTVIHTLQFDSLLYNKDKVEKPDSWADYWAPQKRYGDKIKGHVIAFHPNNLLSVYALIFAAQLGGGSRGAPDEFAPIEFVLGSVLCRHDRLLFASVQPARQSSIQYRPYCVRMLSQRVLGQRRQRVPRGARVAPRGHSLLPQSVPPSVGVAGGLTSP